jgi:F-type H+-transporting ATPase subunit gamma
MAGAREIRTKIKSVQNTRKVTRALEMVSTSKIRRAQEQMRTMRPYVRGMLGLVGHIARANSEYKHPFMQEREPRRIAYLVVSTDRGLCGGLNNNLFRRILADMREWQAKGVEVGVYAIGSKASQFFRRLNGVTFAGHAAKIGDRPTLAELVGIVSLALDAYREGRIDRLYVATNVFVNTMTQQPNIRQLIPLVPGDDVESRHDWDYLYEPSAPEILDHVMRRYLEVLVYQAVVENIASEHAARMVAMKAAGDNAGKLINELTLVYNKARQAAITQEISEIVGGAAAV